MTGAPRCVTVDEAAKLIGGVSRSMLYRLAQQELIPVVRFGKRVLIDEQDIPRIINSFKKEATS